MATYKKQLHDKDGNTIYPDVGIDLDDVVYSDDPTEPIENPSPWIENTDVKPTAFAMPVFIGRAGFTKRTYNNAYLYLENLNTLYAATGVSATITSNTKLQFTLPSGSYVADMQSSLWVGTNTNDYLWLNNRKITSGGTTSAISDAMAPKAGAWAFVNTRGAIGISNTDSLSTYLNTSGNNFSDGNISNNNSFMYVIIYKVG